MIETECEPTESIENVKIVEPKETVIEQDNKKIKSDASNTAVEVDTKKTNSKKSKNSSNQNMKQSSLTNFFKVK